MASEKPATLGDGIEAPMRADLPQKQSLVVTGPNIGERAQALSKIARDYPGWHAWRGTLGGVVYARRSRTSPPMVVRAITAEHLRREIEEAERERGLR